MNVESQPLVELSKILLPSMHLKLGLMKNFVKAMNQEEAAFTYEKSSPDWGKIERRYFHWSTNMRPYQGQILRQAPSRRQKSGLGQFQICSNRIFVKQKGPNYEKLINNLLQSYQKLDCNMPLKIHFLHSHLDFSQRIVVQWVMNTENVSIKTFFQWRRDIKGNGTVLCSLTTAGLWQGITLPRNSSDRQNEKKITWFCVK